VWADRGSRPAAPTQTAAANVPVPTAVCPATGAAAAEGWRAVCLKPEQIKTVCRCEYLAAGN